MTFTVMKTTVLNMVGEGNYDRFSETFVEKSINLGAIDFIDKTEVLDTNWYISTVANQMWYLISTTNYEITRVEWYDASKDIKIKLEKKTFNEMDEEYSYDSTNYDKDKDWQSITGDPVAWIPKEHDVIGIYPACNVKDDKLYIYGRKKHTTLTGSETSAIPDQYQIIPCYFAAAMLLRSDYDEKTSTYEKKYREEVFLAKRTVMDRKKKMPAKWRLYTY